MNRFRNSAVALVCAGWLLTVGAPGASADPTLTPVPQPQGPTTPIAQTPKDAYGSGPIAGTCFSCQPNRVSDNPGAAPGPAPSVSPILTHSNSGADHYNLVVDGVDFTPDKSVHLEVHPDRDGDFEPYITDRFADGSGRIHVEFYNLQTVSPHDRGARGGYVFATDTTTLQTTDRLHVTIFPPVMIDNG
jgi:hypothetical protein